MCSVLHKNTRQRPWPGLEPGPFAPESRALMFVSCLFRRFLFTGLQVIQAQFFSVLLFFEGIFILLIVGERFLGIAFKENCVYFCELIDVPKDGLTD